MKLYIYKKDYYKESREVKDAICSSIKMLYKRIKMYEKQGISFERIFNDDKVKYDKHGKFFTFKIQKSNMQIRILYSYFMNDNESVFLIADYFIKKRNKKDYIKKFDVANHWDPFEILDKAFSIALA
ncbi:hypothetical protein [Ruminococcus sp. zg-924]|uniref:hypothetical protein n=1 Tax=Ruminococcus sp. zg-924 TaxID=2678505 RepID=UPI00210ED3FC|nr:hypothetical protein [Ruminococcus sp. zg-924]MCQ4022806.1 hypothetical protein [Ruminococcus sp. zg-924]